MISFRDGVSSKDVHPALYYAMGTAEMLFHNEGLPLLVTELKPLSIDFSVEQIHRTIVADIMKNMYRHLELMGFAIVLKGDTIHCSYDPQLGML